MSIVLTTDIPGLPRLATGKVRDVYGVGADQVLLVATDRISAFDVVLGEGIPDKGRVLTQLSAFWFAQTAAFQPNHLLSADDNVIAARLAEEGVTVTDELRETLAGRAVLCRRAQPLPIEAVVRGYLSGSGWKAYAALAKIEDEMVDLWGTEVPSGLHESDELPQPIFTPSTKAVKGHDEPMRRDEIAGYIGEWAKPVEAAALRLYAWARNFAAERGILLADTKFEFGTLPGGPDGKPQLILIDEALTPDSSRFWDAAAYMPGGPQASFDKQFVRDYLLSVRGWNHQPPAPPLPPEVIAGTAERYRDAYRRLTGQTLPGKPV